jgi:hypothetical protein
MRADVSRPPAPFGRLATAMCVLVLAACGSIPKAEVRLSEGRSFIAMVPDSVDDVGVDPSVAVSDDGVPYVSYFGFPAVLAEGEIPVTRPIGAPYLTTEDGDDAGAVLLASLTPDTQVWNRGAIAQPRATPSGVTVPFGPTEDPSLKTITPSNAEGTDVAVSGSDVHATWTVDTGVWYGVGPDFAIEPIERAPGAGGPSIAIDEDGTPLVAYVVAGVQPRVTVAERVGERWERTVVATLSECGRECPPPAQLAIVGGEPIVVVVDPSTHELIAAGREGSAWSNEVIASDVVGGASIAAADDTATVAYYTSKGVEVATGRLGDWSIDHVAAVTPAPKSPSASPSPSASASPSPSGGASKSQAPEPIETEPTTGVAVDGEGTAWVAWEDADGVHLASTGDSGRFEEQELSQSDGGVTPSVAVTEDGSSVYLAWFDPVEGDLRVGVSADLGGLQLAAPSPTAPPPSGGEENCGQDGKIVLDVTAPTTAFDPTCLVALAGEPFTITFNNEDNGTIHNIAVLTERDGEEIGATEGQPGPATEELQMKPQEEGDLFFVCQFHPDVMTGTLAVVAAKGGGGGG